MSEQGKYWCFTAFDLSIDYNTWGARYVCWGEEVCPETGKTHHQGYVEFASNKRMGALKLLHRSAHWEKRIGNAEQAIKYCEKDGKFTEIGERPNPKPGRRSDIEEVRELVRQGKGMHDIIDVCDSFQAIRVAEKLLTYKEVKRTWMPEVYWYWGETGTGKSKKAADEAGTEAWWSGRDLKWWQGYDAHKHVVIDDFRGDFCTFHELLRILDRYPYTIECKGGSRQLLATHIWITCPYHPSEVYNRTPEEISQLLRRITTIINFQPNILGGIV